MKICSPKFKKSSNERRGLKVNHFRINKLEIPPAVVMQVLMSQQTVNFEVGWPMVVLWMLFRRTSVRNTSRWKNFSFSKRPVKLFLNVKRSGIRVWELNFALSQAVKKTVGSCYIHWRRSMYLCSKESKVVSSTMRFTWPWKKMLFCNYVSQERYPWHSSAKYYFESPFTWSRMGNSVSSCPQEKLYTTFVCWPPYYLVSRYWI